MTDSLYAARQLNIKNSNEQSKNKVNASPIPKSSTFNISSPKPRAFSAASPSPTVPSTVSSNNLKNI
jgi:hypothetical protein